LESVPVFSSAKTAVESDNNTIMRSRAGIIFLNIDFMVTPFPINILFPDDGDVVIDGS
jgi:hypothetical protein